MGYAVGARIAGAAFDQNSAATLAIPVTVDVPAGHDVILALANENSGGTSGVTSVTDSSGNTYGLVRFGQRSNTYGNELWRARITTQLDAGDVVTVNWGASRTHKFGILVHAIGLAAGAAEATGGVGSELAVNASDQNFSLTGDEPGLYIAVDYSGGGVFANKDYIPKPGVSVLHKLDGSARGLATLMRLSTARTGETVTMGAILTPSSSRSIGGAFFAGDPNAVPDHGYGSGDGEVVAGEDPGDSLLQYHDFSTYPDGAPAGWTNLLGVLVVKDGKLRFDSDAASGQGESIYNTPLTEADFEVATRFSVQDNNSGRYYGFQFRAENDADRTRYQTMVRSNVSMTRSKRTSVGNTNLPNLTVSFPTGHATPAVHEVGVIMDGTSFQNYWDGVPTTPPIEDASIAGPGRLGAYLRTDSATTTLDPRIEKMVAHKLPKTRVLAGMAPERES